MAEVHEVHEEYETVEPRRRGVFLPFLMFLLGGALIAGLVVAFLNVSSTVSWPAGQVRVGPSATVADAGNAQVTPPATATVPSVIPTTPSEPPAVSAPPAETTPPPTTDSEVENPAPPPPPTDTAPSENE
jgi:hypothetical protein